MNGLGGDVGFGESFIEANDDLSTDAIDITSIFGENGINLFGQYYTTIYINNNGNITFGGSLSEYTPEEITGSAGIPIIAPYWADVDTRGLDGITSNGGTSAGTNLVWYDLDSDNGVLTVTWDDVGYFSQHVNRSNAFQLQLINRGNGDFDIVFNYENIDWTTGDASDGTGGLYGQPARIGYSANDGDTSHAYELPASGEQEALLDLDSELGNTGEVGRYVYEVRSGAILIPPTANADYLVVTNGVASLLDLSVLFQNDDFGPGNAVALGEITNVTGGTVTIQDFRLVITATDPSGGFDYTLSNDAGSSTAHVSFTSVVATSGGDGFYGDSGGFDGADLQGAGGSDVLGGTTFDDHLVGGTGDDLILATNGDDVIDGGADIDTVSFFDAPPGPATGGGDAAAFAAAAAGFQGVSVSLATSVQQFTGWGSVILSNVENLTGSNWNDVLLGNQQANWLDGGYGADTLRGGAGDDVYVVKDADDIVIEDSNAGNDLVIAWVSYSLVGQFIESLQLSNVDSFDISGTGNGLANTLTGNDGRNLLTGGASNDTLIGGGGNDTLDGGTGADSMSGGDGDDRFIVDSIYDVATDFGSETPGAPSYGVDEVLASASFTLSRYIEKLTLTGSAAIDGTGNTLANTLTGNGANNRLSGLDGADTLDGGAGADTLVGGAGDDLYYLDQAGDTITEAAGAGYDRVSAAFSYSLSGQQLEELVLSGTDNINGTGNGLANVLIGNSGNNLLDGLGVADTMLGGLGNDTYVVDATGDVVTENAAQGLDTVQASITYTLGANVEYLTLTGGLAISGFGNGLMNYLTGNGANNTLDGGAGNDVMAGGLGDDRYYVDSTGDTILETNAAGSGSDTVFSSVTFNLTGQFLENLTLTGSASVNATGNGLINVVTGNSGNNVLDGQGGADTMAGGLGNDTYVVDHVGDVVQEANGAGTDTVQASVSYSLAGQFLENLTLLFSQNLSATGNSLGNVLTGNNGNNLIDGGLGDDTMAGGLGNDTYYVNSTFDVVTEYADQGTDTVISQVGYTLAGSHIENLLLNGSTSTYANGNGLNNFLGGNAGANTINARGGNDTLVGGLGADTLTGEAGLDVFRFDSTLGGGNVDTITDFTVADDTIQLDDAIFTGAGAPGTLAGAAFWTGAAAHDLDDRIIYNAATGALFYDADGNDMGAAVQFATLGTGLALTNADFVII